MSDLKGRIQEDVKSAMRDRDKLRLSTLRMVTAAIKQREIDGQLSLDDSGVVAVLEKMIKQRADAAEQFRKGNRLDLAEQETSEIEVIKAYMPAPLSADEIDDLVEAALGESGAGSPKDMGKVMALLKPRLQGRADMGAVSAKVKERLTALS